MSVVDLSSVRMSLRARAFILLIAFFYIYGLITDRHFLALAVSLTVFLACVRGYVLLAMGALLKSRIEIPSTIAFDGRYTDIDVAIYNSTPIPIAFAEISIEYSPFIRVVEGAKASLLFIPPRSCVRLKMRFLARVGRHYVGPIDAVVRDPLGLFRAADIRIGGRGYVRVFPAVSEAVIRRLLLYTRSSGLVRAKQSGAGVEFYSLREYREGDDMRRIDWKHFSATQRLFVKDMERETMSYVVFLVDATKDMLSGVYGSTPLDHCSRIIASIARYLAIRGDNIMLTIYSETEILYTKKLVRGMQGFRAVMDLLSRIDYAKYVGEGSPRWSSRASAFAVAINNAISSIPRERVLVLIFTSPGDEDYREALLKGIERLKKMNCEVYIIMPITTVFEARGLEPWQQALYRIKVFERMKEELDFAKKLRGYGVNVVATGPQYIPQTVVSIIERYRA